MATIKDIAKMTGCSAMTVSRVLNNPALVKPETRRKILAAVESSDYTQNRVARSLVKGCSYNILVYIPSMLDISEPFVAHTVSAIGERLGMSGYSLSLRRSMAIDNNCDGVIAMGLNIEDEESFLAIAQKKPAVLYGNSERFTNWVDVDNYKGIYNMTCYIADKGYKDIAYIGMDFHAHYVIQRKQGFMDAIADRGLPLRDEYLVTAENSEKSGFDACERLIATARPAAIVCATDLIAVGCIHALQRHKIQIPGDVAVSGFDGFGMERTVFPVLTTARQPLYRVGARLADAVVNLINGVPIARGEYIEPEIISGDSV